MTSWEESWCPSLPWRRSVPSDAFEGPCAVGEFRDLHSGSVQHPKVQVCQGLIAVVQMPGVFQPAAAADDQVGKVGVVVLGPHPRTVVNQASVQQRPVALLDPTQLIEEVCQMPYPMAVDSGHCFLLLFVEVVMGVHVIAIGTANVGIAATHEPDPGRRQPRLIGLKCENEHV